MSRFNRRNFLLQGGAGVASARLIGAALAPGMFLRDGVAAQQGKPQQVVIPTHEMYGDLDERIDLPASWQVNVMNMAGHNAPVLTPEQIRKSIQTPIGTRPLSELAAGKKRVVVSFDDMERPTPIHEVLPQVIAELNAAGVKDENILLLVSHGTHRASSAEDVGRKIGKPMAQRFAWMNHNCFDNLKDVGETSRKNRIRLSYTLMSADLRITISGVRPHGRAGYGGGAKAVLPGLASIDCIRYNHETIGLSSNDNELKIFHNNLRLDMEEVARLGGIDFSLQVVYNSKRRTCAVFAGDIVEAHHAACRMANKHYRTPTLKNADVVISNAYPLCTQATLGLIWVNRSVREGGTGVLVMQHPMMMSGRNFWNESVTFRGGRSYWDVQATRPKTSTHGLIVYSQYMDKRTMDTPAFPVGTTFAQTWDQVTAQLRERHKGDARVAVYPYGPLQHLEEPLDE